MILELTFPQVKRGGAEGTRTPDPHTASPSCRDSRTCADEQSLAAEGFSRISGCPRTTLHETVGCRTGYQAIS